MELKATPYLKKNVRTYGKPYFRLNLAFPSLREKAEKDFLGGIDYKKLAAAIGVHEWTVYSLLSKKFSPNQVFRRSLYSFQQSENHKIEDNLVFKPFTAHDCLFLDESLMDISDYEDLYLSILNG